MKHHKVLCIIPARSGSQGIPLKNIRTLKGIPLIKHTIKTALDSKLIDDIIVSTDSRKIAEISKKMGTEVPFLRPKKYSKNNTKLIDVVKHALKFFEKKIEEPDMIVILQPTSPIRKPGLIDNAIKLILNSKATSVISVFKVEAHPFISFWYEGKFLKPFKNDFEKHSVRQKRKLLFCPNGAVYVCKTSTIKKYNSLYGPKIKPIIINEKEFNIDIDDIFDLFMAEMTMSYWKKYKKKFN